MTALSGTSTPRFESTFDMAFGTPQDLFGFSDKQDYFGNVSKGQPDFSFSGMFGNSPYPTQMDITPPQTAIDQPTSWPYVSRSQGDIDQIFDQRITHTSPEINPRTVKIQYGQTTPPDEAERAPDMDDLKDSFMPIPKSTKKHSAPSSIKSTKPPKKSKKKNVESNEENDKRSRFLERNRVAASKCRQKKKEYNGHLEQRAKDLERKNTFLKMEMERLANEKIMLMTQMTAHVPGECNCDAIHKHLASFQAQYSDSSPPSEQNEGSLVSSPTE